MAAKMALENFPAEDISEYLPAPQARPLPHHLFISACTVGLDKAAGELDAKEIAVSVTGHALITVRKDLVVLRRVVLPIG